MEILSEELIMILGIEVMFVVSCMSESPKESISLVYKFVSFFVALVFFFSCIVYIADFI